MAIYLSGKSYRVTEAFELPTTTLEGFEMGGTAGTVVVEGIGAA
jgi:hypothetical protein